MMAYLRKLVTGSGYRYTALPEPDSPSLKYHRGPSGWRRRKPVILATGLAVLFALLVVTTFHRYVLHQYMHANGGHNGSQTPLRITSFRSGCEARGNCFNDVSPKLWGQYSPFFSVPSDIESKIPSRCEVTFVSVLSRHGARDPTSRKTELYSALIERIQSSVLKYGARLEFLEEYDYNLGKDQLTFFGEKQMVDLGIAVYNRYKTLVGEYDPFIRAAGSQRVIESAKNFTKGLYMPQDRRADDQMANILVVPETEGFNNTLNHGTCPEFEAGSSSNLGREMQNIWKEIWAPPVRDRLNEMLPGANLTLVDVIYMMDLCPFNTVANRDAEQSDFCRIFSEEEWLSYDYFESLGKWYGYGPGNPLGSTQGVGYVNELIARLTGRPVQDKSMTNSTLDSSPETFPLNRRVYADFSHDNTMTSIYGALGLYNGTENLSVEHRLSPEQTSGYSASWTVPFGGRMYVEKMRCDDDTGQDKGQEELVRVLINDRVVPLRNCKADPLGRCTLSAFVESLSFARGGGLWHKCFT